MAKKKGPADEKDLRPGELAEKNQELTKEKSKLVDLTDAKTTLESLERIANAVGNGSLHEGKADTCLRAIGLALLVSVGVHLEAEKQQKGGNS